MNEFISIEELAQRENLSDSTLRRYIRAKLISYRRRGYGKHAPLEFNYPIVHRELESLRGTVSRTMLARPADPTLVTILTELRELREDLKPILPCKS